MSKIYTDGMPLDELRTKLRDLTDSTKKSRQVHDTRHPGFATSLISFDPIKESRGIVADVMLGVVGDKPMDGDIIVIPGQDNKIGGIGMLFDVEPSPGDWGHLGDGYRAKVIQAQPHLGIGHEFIDKGQGALRG